MTDLEVSEGEGVVTLRLNRPDQRNALSTGLLTELGHRDVIDLGDITTARGTEMYLPLWLRLWGALGPGTFNISVAR